ncbi:hypothetical protein [Mycobacterium intracellulare]|uniref:hypothetical protein n=1 Tax=Mycobacterium intracellulare TaxID=1767 RepID=UPI001041C607
MSAVPRPRCSKRASFGLLKQLSVLLALLFAGYCATLGLGTGPSNADVGALGPPPSEFEVRQAIAGLYAAAQPADSRVDIQFDGPILVGIPTDHDISGNPWCPICAQHSVNHTQMYPVYALVKVTTTFNLGTSAIYPSEPVQTSANSGTTCAGVRDCAYYFYRDTKGNWQVI